MESIKLAYSHRAISKQMKKLVMIIILKALGLDKLVDAEHLRNY
jgi:hypothetical protein